MISAAIHGQGVALGRRPLIDAMLSDRRLIAPIEGTLSSARAYFVVVAPASAGRDRLRLARPFRGHLGRDCKPLIAMS